jgi:membrane protein DedA with SNARE-associated domain
MPWCVFTAYNVAGALLWNCTWGLGTYYLRRDIHFIAAFFHHHRLLFIPRSGRSGFRRVGGVRAAL